MGLNEETLLNKTQTKRYAQLTHSARHLFIFQLYLKPAQQHIIFSIMTIDPELVMKWAPEMG